MLYHGTTCLSSVCCEVTDQRTKSADSVVTAVFPMPEYAPPPPSIPAMVLSDAPPKEDVAPPPSFAFHSDPIFLEMALNSGPIYSL